MAPTLTIPQKKFVREIEYSYYCPYPTALRGLLFHFILSAVIFLFTSLSNVQLFHTTFPRFLKSPSTFYITFSITAHYLYVKTLIICLRFFIWLPDDNPPWDCYCWTAATTRRASKNEILSAYGIKK